MKFSVITVNYNNFDGLKKTAESILSQTWKNFEWIIIDGGSTDGSREYIINLNDNLDKNEWNPISYWCSEPDKGIYNALNKGIRHCKGEYISCMNSGDTFFSEETLKLVFFKNYSDTVLYGDALFEYSDYNEIRKYPNSMSFKWLYNETINHQASFCRAEVLKRNLFDENYKIMSDRKLWLELYLSGYSFKHIPLIIARYDHSGISATNEEKWLVEYQKLHDEIIPHYIQKVRILDVIAKICIEISCRFKSILK